MFKFQKYFGWKKTDQTSPMPGAHQVQMRSGGFGWEVDDWMKLDRFLILGTEGGTFYVGEQQLTVQAAEAVLRCVQADGARVVQRIVDISTGGRAPKNDPALFALALSAKLGDEATRAAAYRALPKVARIGTHLFHFVEYCKGLGGLGGNGFKRALGRWYTDKDAARLALQAVKYQQRDGWSHRDVLRLAHAKAPTADHQAIFEWIVKGWSEGAEPAPETAEKLRLIHAFELAKRTETGADMAKLVADHRLPHEAVPNHFKQHREVWEALLPSMPAGALLRNLNKLTALDLLANTSAATGRVREVLGDAQALERARVHPMAVLLAMKTYQAGRGFRGKLTWKPVGRIVDALDEAFYLAFGTVKPTGKRLCLALDVSGSMSAPVSSTRFLSCKEAVGALALVTASVEPSYEMVAFTSGGKGCHGYVQYGSAYGWAMGISPVTLTPRMRMDSVVRKLERLPMGGTDCALPMRWAAKTRTPVDCFVIYTDNESWAGDVHVDQALRNYRQHMSMDAKLVAVALAGDRFSVANPDDAGQLDVVGFDTATPNVISDFITG